jgi:ectoine hydroxylase-related dioxygenase (phytanoyl-CoA dioxygenase family)
MNNIVVYMSIPVVTSIENADKFRNDFYDTYGCVILKNVFSPELMDEYNEWCISEKDNVLKSHANTHHPKQKDKFVINDVMERMSATKPELLLKLVNNPLVNQASDILLGYARYGAVTTHWLEAGGARQLSHTDYPCHVGSGKFWNNDPSLIDKYFTEHQLNHVLPHYSIQMLFASDKMDVSNGSTECIPGSHLIHDVDKKIFDPEFYRSIEDKFINTTLNKGDCFIFNRRLIHRGGWNKSDKRRNSLIMQKVWMFGLGQHKFDHALILNNVSKYLSESDRKAFELRLIQPYPINTTDHN